ncbi:MAG: InlB B-repeat-containing protein, partial [Ilumatobacteraceae bacterium]
MTFGAPSSDGGLTIANYEYSVDGGESWTARSPASTVSPVLVTSLSNGTNYGIALRAVTGAGAGSASAVLYGQPVAAPSAPLGVSVTVASQRLSVSFTAPSSNGSPITSYEYSTNGGTSWTSAATTATTFDITGLTNGTTYSVRVRAINAIGAGAATVALSRTPAAVPGSPIISTINNTATLASVATTALSVSFTPGANNGAEISNYEYATSTDGGVTFSSWTTRSPASSFSPLVIESLTAGVTYHVQIRAVNANGSGQSSEISSATAGGAAATVTITYNSQGGSAITTGTSTVGGQIASSPGTPTRSGYSFSGWFTAASGGSALSFPYTHNQNADFTLHAQWSANSYTVTYNGNENTSGSIPAPASATFGSSFTASTNSGALARSGFSFVGWNSSADGTGTDFTAGASAAWSLAANTTLYAKWNDVDAPTASVTTARIRNSESATVESTETGSAYLVNTSITVTNLVSITSAANSVWNQVTISAVGTPTLLSATGLVDGTYKVYAADSANNLSAASTGTITIDSTAPTLTLAVSSTTSSTSSISFILSGNEDIDCATIETTPGVDFDLTGISTITSIVQTSATVCVLNANSTATAGGGAVTSTLTRATSFSVADTAGNTQTSLSGSPQSVTVTVSSVSGGGGASTATTTTSTTSTTTSTTTTTVRVTTTVPATTTTTPTTTTVVVPATTTTVRPRRTTTTTSTTIRPV